MKSLFILLCAFALSTACNGEVDIPDYNQLHKPYESLTCIDEQNQQAMDKCGEQSLAKATAQMNAFLNNLKKSYISDEPDLLQPLQDAQVAWQAYMESSCRIETYYSRGGSGFHSIWNACLETKTNERISYLSWMMDNP